METVVDKSKCECCNINFLQNRDYDKHIKTKKHLNKVNNVPMECCEFCEYKTLKKSTLLVHIRKEHKENYNIKKISESNNFMHGCECCNKILLTKYILNKFLKSRKSELNYIKVRGFMYHCEWCKNPFLNFRHYMHHIKIIHPEETKIKYPNFKDELLNNIN